MSAPTPLTQDRLDALLHERAEMTARPRSTPREVLAKWLDNFGVGVGASVATGVGMWLLHAPDTAMAGTAGAAGLATFAAMMVWRGMIDEASDWRNVRSVRRIVSATQRDYATQTRTMRTRLDAAYDEIEALERSLDRMTHERDVAVAELTRERHTAQTNARSTFVPAVEVTPQELADATEMVRWRYQFSRHLSRRVAEDTKQWTQPRWEAAKTVLEDAGVITITNGVTTYPATLDEAMQRLGAYMIQARRMSVPAVNRAVGYTLYVESDEA